jgi:prepilin-type N-terminal cleavage/methylation domain-containing protein
MQVRGFTMLELTATLAVIGTVAAMAFASMKEIVEAEQARNAAARFATDLRRERAEAVQRQMYSFVQTQTTPTGVSVVFRARRLGGAGGSTPCEEMAAGNADSTQTEFYPHVALTVQETGPVSGGLTQTMCFTQQGAPRTNDLMDPESLDLEVTRNGDTQLFATIDPLGVVTSSVQTESTGIASTSLHPMDTMMDESAPVPPGAFDEPAMPIFEIDPGVFIEAGDTGADTGVNPCDPYYGTCPAECVTDPTCSNPCDSCYDPCAADPPSCDPCILDPVCCGVAGCVPP